MRLKAPLNLSFYQTSSQASVDPFGFDGDGYFVIPTQG